MILTISIGNDAIRIGLAKGKDLIETWSLATPYALYPNEAEVMLYDFFAAVERRGKCTVAQIEEEITGSIIASVVPSLLGACTSAAQKICRQRPLIVGPGLKTGLKMKYKDPAEIGADRIANIIGARELFDAPFIVVDLGTTTNLSVVDNQGVFCGGIIAPGLRLSAEALAKGAAQLVAVDIVAPESVIGKSTKDAMRSGIILGEVARLDGLIEAIWHELGYETEVVLTGFDAEEIAALSRHAQQIEKKLTLRGLNELFAMNRLDGNK